MGDDPFAAADDFAGGGDDPFAGTSAAAGDDPFGSSDLGDYGADAGDDLGGYGADLGSTEPVANADNDVFGGMVEAEQPITLGGDEPVLGAPTASSKYVEWQNNHQSKLVEKRNAARERKEEQLTAARAELEAFQSERAANLKKIKAANRDEESAKQAEISNVMEFGSSWEKVNRLVNLKPNPDEKPGTSTVDRMRTLLIQLKNEKPKA